jgi:2-C-methyl-D-erythritol 4-phosphate cytidylyltransferase
MKVSVIIPAAGVGKRMGAGRNKQLLTIDDKTITELTIKQFLALDVVEEIILVINKEDVKVMNQMIESLNATRVFIKTVMGGKERKDSVNNGIEAVGDSTTHVLIHDGARPFVDKELLVRLLSAMQTNDAVVPVLASKDTLKWMESAFIERTIDRNYVYKVQTPQCFTIELAKKIREHTNQSDQSFTDEASICEDMGIKVFGAVGSEWNIKLTTPEDMVLGKAIYHHLKGENKCE